MHFNIFSEGICGKVGLFHNGKNPIEVFSLSRSASALPNVCLNQKFVIKDFFIRIISKH